MSEVITAAGFLFCALTYWLGGQGFPKWGLDWLKKESWEGDNTAGQKWIRRFVMPTGLALILLALGAPFLVFSKAFPFVGGVLPACVMLSVGAHLGYGADVFRYFLAGAVMGVGPLFIGIHWTAALPAVFHAGWGAASLRDNKFGWAIVALLTGASIGIAYVVAV